MGRATFDPARGLYVPQVWLWTCPTCGSPDIQDQCWVRVNADRILDSCESYRWCSECDEDAWGLREDPYVGSGETKYMDCIHRVNRGGRWGYERLKALWLVLDHTMRVRAAQRVAA